MTSHQLDLVRHAMTADDRLDDLARVRIWNGLAASLAGNDNALHADASTDGGRHTDRHHADRRRHTDRRRRATAIAIATGFAAAALAAALAFIVLRPTPAPRVSTVAADTTLTLPLGPHGRAAVVGPARFEIVGRAGAATTVRIDQGVLLAEFSGGPGRSLRVVAPHVTVEVVGTLFSVDVRAAQTCVSVEHGTVRLTWMDRSSRAGRPPLALTGGHTYCTSSGVQPIAPSTRDALLRHERVITAWTSPPEPVIAATATPTTPSPPAAAVPAEAAAPTATTGPSRPTSMPMLTSSPPKPRRALTPLAPVAAPPRAATVAAPASATKIAAQPSATTVAAQPSATTVAAPPPATTVAAPPPATSVAATTVAAQPPAPTITAQPPAAAAADAQARPSVGPDELYRQAEAALVRRDARTADRLLSQLVAAHPQSTLVEQALYDRARIAYQQRAWTAARKHLDQLLAGSAPRLVEQARYLECRIAVDTKDKHASGCLDAYRRAYPRSPHAADVLAMLVQLDHAAGGCSSSAARISELVQQHPASKLAAAWRARCPERR